MENSIALIGCGDWGKNIARTLKGMDALGAILYCEGFLDARTKNIAEEHGVPLETFEKGLKNHQYKGIAIATPPSTHFSLAKKALNHKKHIFVEKPLVKDSAENKTLISLAKAQNTVLMVGHLLRYHPAYEALLARVPSLGKIHFVTARRMNWGKIYKQDNIVWDYLPHDLSMVLPIFNTLPTRVVAGELNFVHPHLSDVCGVSLSFGDNQHARIFLSRINPYKEQKLMVVGDRGAMVFDDTQAWPEKLVIFDTPFPTNDSPELLGPSIGTPINLSPAEPLKLELVHFISCIRHGKMPRTSGQDALDILSIIQAVETRNYSCGPRT